MAAQKMVLCRDSGLECDWEARDSDERELVATAQEHARRRHALTLSADQVRRRLREVRSGIGGI